MSVYKISDNKDYSEVTTFKVSVRWKTIFIVISVLLITIGFFILIVGFTMTYREDLKVIGGVLMAVGLVLLIAALINNVKEIYIGKNEIVFKSFVFKRCLPVKEISAISSSWNWLGFIRVGTSSSKFCMFWFMENVENISYKIRKLIYTNNLSISLDDNTINKLRKSDDELQKINKEEEIYKDNLYYGFIVNEMNYELIKKARDNLLEIKDYKDASEYIEKYEKMMDEYSNRHKK